jgi:hypothetical protein
MALVLALRRHDAWFRSAAMLFACTSASILAVLEFARTKLPWYDAQVFPLIALTIGLGIASLLVPPDARHRSGLDPPRGPVVSRRAVLVVLVALFAPPLMRSTYARFVEAPSLEDFTSQSWYGAYFARLERTLNLNRFRVIDGGFQTAGGLPAYHGALRFYRALANARGAQIEIAGPAETTRGGIWVSCDIRLKAHLLQHPGTRILDTWKDCIAIDIPM